MPRIIAPAHFGALGKTLEMNESARLRAGQELQCKGIKTGGIAEIVFNISAFRSPRLNLKQPPFFARDVL